MEVIVWKGKLCLDGDVGFSKCCEGAGASGWYGMRHGLKASASEVPWLQRKRR